MSNFILMISAFITLGLPFIVIFASVIILISKIVERKEEKEKEDLDKYKKY